MKYNTKSSRLYLRDIPLSEQPTDPHQLYLSRVEQMNLFTNKYLALFLLLISHFLSSAHADSDFSSGVTLRYFELTAANEPSAMIGIGYSIKWGSVDYAIELGAPTNK